MRPKEMREQWAKLLGDAKAMATKAEAEGRDLTAEEKTSIEKALTDSTQLRADFTMLERLDADNGVATAPVTEPRAGRPGTTGTIDEPKVDSRSIGQQFIDNEQWQAFRQSVAPNGFSDKTQIGVSPAVQYRTLLTGASATSGGAMVFPDVQGGYYPQGLNRPLTIRDVITIGTTGSDTVEYVRLTAQTNNAATVTESTQTSGSGLTTPAQGVKPESAMTLAKVTTTVKTIAHWIPATKRALSDAGQLRTLIDNFLRYGLEEELEDQIVAGGGTGEDFDGIGHLSGVQSQAFVTDLFTTTRKARTLVRTVGRDIPTAYLLNPADWETLDLLLDNNARFYFGGPQQMGNPTLWGLPVVESEAVPQGTAYVGNFRKCVLWEREQASIQVSDSHADFFIRNMVAILAEMRAAFGILQPTSVVEIALA